MMKLEVPFDSCRRSTHLHPMYAQYLDDDAQGAGSVSKVHLIVDFTSRHGNYGDVKLAVAMFPVGYWKTTLCESEGHDV
jgi:hypothetical protein